MTFQEANALISNMSANPYSYNNELFTAIVVPEILEERIKFLSDIKDGKININDSFNYSSSNSFVVYTVLNKSFRL